MHFVGLDLAWGERKPTGVAVLDGDGRLVHIASAQDDSSILDEVRPFVDGDCLVAIDAPLVVNNPTGQRGCETDLNRDFAKFEAGAHPSNMGKPEFADTPRGARIAEALGLDMDPQSRATRRAIEVYPHPATVVLFRLGRTLKYKNKPGRTLTQLRTELLRLMDEIERLAQATVPLRVGDHPDWIAMRAAVETAQRKSDLRRAEDPVDAVVCAYVGLFATRRPAAVTVYGDFATGYIVTPTLPADLTPAPPEPTPGVVSDAVARYAERRPALKETTEHYLALVKRLLDDAGINYLSVTARTKSVASFAAKADRSSQGQRLYTDPSTQITDQVGLRVITYLREDVTAVGTVLAGEMNVLADLDMGQVTAREGRWGYASRHMLVAIEGESQPASVQIRTVLQHAWAEFEHDIRYKGTVPEQDAAELDRRFTLAAGLLELADREFTEIRDRLRASMADDRTPTVAGVGIATPVLATYLGHRFPEAGWSRTEHYAWISDLLGELGILTLDALEELLTNLDTDAVNEKMDYRFPAGAVRRLDDALLATFADRYVGLAGNAHREALLQTRLQRLNGTPKST
ncbi:putative RNase H-like nuclease/ppGpp synthetase/RelA/SpoT-type nucleotidyltransferase [Mycolicibacterium sp. BK556]|uniref:bifunctional ribonuclease/(p)ppGpp synthase n=1 Tax=Mycobacteriaceae TaxID=1762 RepID=UPI00105D9857|nr:MULTISPECIES: bifunctional ribonuclease/(p)ppGpp synthase [Mycobacteriaceae]MBB3601778.1 putative RNase H-like nuclease/ppGpp synthetase/RelA/SpoT-type nucleotidyltransferase [Mycolicibacterium sp. BK556]MBB3631530.1 putative RNase H-like nuclease/ppGpp synthetase/RelA/SpoT-type nucleotidyltransferase [Mycolicibacterium sp. BK607]MBB3749534.1 putative RNase H-like nuclease/ppGpp synthetase/RelA/SpoT-type nucleotidyltransferase [Mycolicibacterium sp. BK634]TDO14248.1 putative RNase H-like nuc